jgi:transposase
VEVRETFPHVLPNMTPLQLDTWHIDDVHAQITLLISSTRAKSRCPGCDVPARYVHSHYTRTLADLPWSGYRVTWRLRVRKLFCRNTLCPRHIFTERLPGIASPWARRTLRLTARLLASGLALGGAAGVRLSRHFGLTVSRHTRLRVIHRTPCPAIASPQGLSMDDFALRTRHTYGTILLDLARRRPVALLPDREATTVAQWLQAHPGVEVLVRGRVEAYAEAARLGTPTACQVADRFHLLQNLADVLTQVFTAHAPQLARITTQRTAAPTPVHDPSCPAAAPEPSSVPLAPQPSSTVAARLAHTKVGTGTGFCTIVNIPPLDTREECLLTAEFAEGQIIFGGVAPLAEIGAVARSGILGGTDDLRKARGDALLVVTTSGIIAVTVDLDQPARP